MIRYSDGSVRRILTSPAVHPCDQVSPSALLISLISLGRKISDFKSRDIASAKRDSRNTIRLVEVLLLFLEELEQEISRPRSNSFVISLSEVQLVFQKILFLLEDCACQDGRLWMLVKSGEVAAHFRVVGRDLATALEVFPLSSVTLSNESKDCVEFVARQAKRLGSIVEPGDCWTLNFMIRVMKGFEREVIPDPNELKQVLGYLRIRNWRDYESEIRFLEEICSQGVNEDKMEASSLLGFMAYCLCVVFDLQCTQSARRNVCENNENGILVSYLNEEDLRCPISLEIMTDPVTISTGHTYNRDSIQKWFRTGNPSCPKTGKRLQSLDCVPNSALQRLARRYAMENGIDFPKAGGHRMPARADFVASRAYKEAIKMASDHLAIKLAIGTAEEKNKAAYKIHLLTKRNIANRALFVESGLVPYLLNLLFSKDLTIQENAVGALLDLSKDSKGKATIVQMGGLQPIVNLLKKGVKLETQQQAAAVLFYLSSMAENRDLIGAMQDVFPGLVRLISVGCDRGMKNALVAIFGLLTHSSNHHKALGANIVPLLADLLRSLQKEDVITDSLAVLSALAEKPGGAAAILQCETLNIVVKIFCSSSSSSIREHCASLMQALCINGGRDVVQVLAKNHSLMGSLYSVLTQGTPRARKKARSLLGILHEYSEKGSSSSYQVPRETFIPVW